MNQIKTTVTELETAMLKNIVNSEFGDYGSLENTVWTDVLCDNKSQAAVLGSLVKKDLVWQNGRGKEATCGLSREGKELCREIFSL